jgi:hypothetical protein
MKKLFAALFLSVSAAACATSGLAVIEKFQEYTPQRYPDAVALVLENRVQATVDEGGEGMVTEAFTRVKILDKKATDCSSGSSSCRLERAVCYNESWDTVELVEGRTIAPDGTVLELKKDDVQDMTFTTWAIPDQDQRCYVYRVKGATPGAIFEEHYRIRSKKIVGVGGTMIQDRDPVLYAEYTLSTPADYRYKYKLKNTAGLKIETAEKTEGKRKVLTLTARELPALVMEDGMVAPDDVLAQVKIANEYVSAFAEYPSCRKITSWEDMGRCWNEMIKSRQEVTPAIRQVVDQIAKEAHTETEKVKAIWKFMNDKVRYVGFERGLAGFIPLSAEVVCTKQYGDCKAVAGLIAVLGRALGLRADPILIGTRPQLGQLDTDLPGPFHFNHSIARVEADGKVYWLDATNRTSSFDTTLYPNQGVHVVIGDPDRPRLEYIPVQPPEQSTSTTQAVFTPGPDGEMRLELVRTSTGNSANSLRGTSFAYNAKQWQDWIESQIASSYSQAVVEEQSYQGKENNEEPFVIKLKARIPHALQSTGTGLSFQVKELFPSGSFQYFELPKRNYPLDMGYLWVRQSRFEVQIPEGMEATGLPRNIEYEDEFVKLERLSQIEGDRVVIIMSWSNKAFQIPPEKYLEARKSFHKVLDATSSVILFEPPKKKK